MKFSSLLVACLVLLACFSALGHEGDRATPSFTPEISVVVSPLKIEKITPSIDVDLVALPSIVVVPTWAQPKNRLYRKLLDINPVQRVSAHWVVENHPDWVAQVIHQQYGIRLSLAKRIWSQVRSHTKHTQVDPLLMLAVIGQESRFDPRAVSTAGARGLTQVIPKWHQGRLRKGENLFDVQVSVRVGVGILDHYLSLSDDRIIQALQRYNGSRRDTQWAYSRRVLGHERELMKALAKRSHPVWWSHWSSIARVWSRIGGIDIG